jgi:L-lactate dehydrogenase complex protein LldF
MPISSFRQRIRQSIENETLQIALDNNTERRLRGRALAFESIPDWRERRRRAHAVRADVIEHLDEYMLQFIRQNRENGVIVHCAKDAAEAIKVVLEIVRNLPPPHTGVISREEKSFASPGVSGGEKVLIAKSKSMVSEEINFNHAMEAEGIRVVETDLGEYIVQLRHERPSHIITPAAHLRKEQVGELFQEKLGIPYTTDIPTLTATARKVLREVFLSADIGLSGVNFGVAETGALCIITNEGNGRMVTTIPPVHIALMGLERIVPDLDDLALMLSLLPRSATGQKLTVYTQLLHQPFEGQTRHLIILDNGRSRLRNSPLKESLYCIRCGACLNACPVFRELSGHAYIGQDGSIAPYPGPIGSVVSPGLMGENFVQLAQASSLCGACKDACPVDIDLPKMLTRVRAGQIGSQYSVDGGQRRRGAVTRSSVKGGAGLSHQSRFFLKVYGRVASSPKLFAASQKLAALGSLLLAPFSQWMRLPAATGWGYSKDLPRFAGKTFRERFSQQNTHAIEFSQSKNVQNEVTPLSPSLAVNKIEQFTKELTALGGHVHQSKDVTEEIVDFLKEREINRIHLEPGALNEDILRAAGVEFTYEPDPAIRVGVTKAICGLADTGSILEADGAGRPLHASLLPEIHIAILIPTDILPSLPDAMPLVKDKGAAAFITGPSRTADIEMTLTIGVHGPKEIHVFVDDSKSG